jgi:type I restriction enzyme S subunit
MNIAQPTLTAGGNGQAIALEAACEFIRGVTFDTAETSSIEIPSGVPILRAGNIQNEIDFHNDLLWVPPERVSSNQLLRPGDIVVCMSSGSASVVGKTCHVRRHWRGSVGAFCGIIRPKDPRDSDFLANWLRSPSFTTWRDAQARGANIQNLRFSEMAKIILPWPPQSQRHRIAARLDEQLAAAAQTRAAVQAQLDAARGLPAAHLRAVFNSPAASRWPKRPIGEVAKIQSGYAFKSEWFAGDGIRLLRNANVSQDRIDWTETVRLPATRRAEFPTYELSEGDIILSLDRPVVSGGLKVARVSSGDLPALLLQRVGRFQLREGIEANYLFHFLHTQDFIGEITAHDQSLGVPHVSPKQVEHVQLPVPPLAEQRTVAARIETQLAEASVLAAHLSARLTTLDHLPAALLREAFNGRV